MNCMPIISPSRLEALPSQLAPVLHVVFKHNLPPFCKQNTLPKSKITKRKTFSWHCEHQNHACLHAEMPSLAEMIRAGRRGHGTFNMNLSKE